MTGPTARRTLRGSFAVSTVLVGAVAGAVLLSGSDQPVTAHPYPPWQELPPPPMTPRAHALGVQVGHRVLVLGGRDRTGAPLRDGATYDLRTGLWRRVTSPVPVRPDDHLVVAGGVVVLRHAAGGHRASWWTFDPKYRAWSSIRGVPSGAGVPSSLGSEVYVLSGARVVVLSVQLGRWTPLPADRLRPALRPRVLTATPRGPVVTGYAGSSRERVSDRWDGLAWHRSRSGATKDRRAWPGSRPAGLSRQAAGIWAGGRLILVGRTHAWIYTP